MSFFRRRLTGTRRTRVIVCLTGFVGIFLLFYFWNDFCLWRADASMANRDQESAQRWINRSRWVRREVDARTCLLQLRNARRREDYQEVERLLQQAAQLGVARSEVQRERWLAMAQTNQFGQMQGYWDQLLTDPRDDEPEIARAHYTWAMLHHNVDLAKQTLDLWHQDRPKDFEPLWLMGRYYQSVENWEQAEDFYRRAFALAPRNDECRLSFARALQKRLKAKEAVPLFQEYLRRHPDDLVAIEGLAQCLATNGDIDAAIRLLKRALEQNPTDFTIQMTYGEFLLSTGDAAAAAVVLEQAHRLVPEHANLANVLARAWKATGRASEAEPLFAFVAESRPDLERLQSLDSELRRDPNNLELRMEAAAITAKYVSRKDAIRWYENLLLIAPHFLPAHHKLTELYQQLGNDKLAEYHQSFEKESLRKTHGTLSSETEEKKPGTR